MSFEDAIRLLMVSFDSTIKANLSVGLPLDLSIYINDSLTEVKTHKITEDNEYFRMVSSEWADALKKSLAALPKFEFNNWSGTRYLILAFSKLERIGYEQIR